MVLVSAILGGLASMSSAVFWCLVASTTSGDPAAGEGRSLLLSPAAGGPSEGGGVCDAAVRACRVLMSGRGRDKVGAQGGVEEGAGGGSVAGGMCPKPGGLGG